MKYKTALVLTLAAALSACASAPAKQVASAPANTPTKPPAKPAPEEPAAVPELANTSIAELERMVASGDLKAHVELGSRYGLGKGVEKNAEKAVALLHVAADRNDAQAQFLLGTAYFSGEGVPKSEAEASKLFEQSAAQHYTPAAYWTGYMIAYGRGGLKKSWAAAIPYLWDAALQDDSNAEFLLAYAYDKGTDIDRNTKAAAYWYRRASSKQVNLKAYYNLSLLIEHGEVPWQEGDPDGPPKHNDAASPAKPAAGGHN